MEFSAKGVQLVRATVDDAAQSIAILQEYFEAVRVVLRDTPEEIIATLSDDRRGIWLAMLDSVPVGCIAYRPLPNPVGAGEVKRLYVRPDVRGRGIASQLLAALETFAVKQGVETLYLDTKDDLKAAIAFYECNGYQRCERYNQNPQATIFLRKRMTCPLNPHTTEHDFEFRRRSGKGGNMSRGQHTRAKG